MQKKIFHSIFEWVLEEKKPHKVLEILLRTLCANRKQLDYKRLKTS